MLCDDDELMLLMQGDTDSRIDRHLSAASELMTVSLHTQRVDPTIKRKADTECAEEALSVKKMKTGKCDVVYYCEC